MKPTYNHRLTGLLLALFAACFSMGQAFAQQELQIHHINVNNGDATMIGIYDHSTQKYTAKILIDGGLSTAGASLLPYIQKIAADTHFKYIILTHYHNDHYTGLNALGSGQLTADSLVDPGGYDFKTYFPAQPRLKLLAEPKPASMTVASQWLSMVSKATSHHFLNGRSEVFISYGTGNSSGLGRKLLIGQLGGLPVTLECVAGWGNTLNNGPTVADPLPDKNNANNFSLAFVLRCGEFRYFIGGDLGGSSQDVYINQEDPLIRYLAIDLPAVHTLNGQLHGGGHICGFKADHHGSSYANSAAFMGAMSPTVTVTSAGDKSGWHLPREKYLGLLSALQPLSGQKGVYFTNLHDWGTGKNSLTTAQSLFKNKPGISFDYGNPQGHAYSYMIRVKPEHLDTESDFEVARVDITQADPYTSLSVFQCHKK